MHVYMSNACNFLVLISTFGYNCGKNERDAPRIAALIGLINKYIESHGEALKKMSLADLRRDANRPYYGLYNYSVDYNLKPHFVEMSGVNAFEQLTAVLLSVNHNDTTVWTTTTPNSFNRRAATKAGNHNHDFGESKGNKKSPSPSFEDSKSNERFTPDDIKRFYIEDIEQLRKTTKDPFDEVTPLKLNYQDNDATKPKSVQLTNNEGDTVSQNNNLYEGRGERRSENSRNVKNSGSVWDNSNKKDDKSNEDYGYGKKVKQDVNDGFYQKARDDWDKPAKDSWDANKDTEWNKKVKDDWDDKPVKDSWDTNKEGNSNKKANDDWDDKPLKDSWDTKKEKSRDDWDKPLKDTWDKKKEKSKDDWDKPLKDSWNTNKEGNSNKKARDDWDDKPLKDSWDTKKEKSKDDWDKPLKDSWDTKKEKSRDDWEKPLKDSWDTKRERSKDDWDKPLKDDWDTKKEKPKDDWDKPLKDNWDTKKEKSKDDWDKPLKDNWDTKKEKSKDDWDKPLKDNWDTKKEKPKDDWDKPLKDSWDTKKDNSWNKNTKDHWDKPKSNRGDARSTKGEWQRPQKPKIRFDRISAAEKPRYPAKTYNEKPRHHKRDRPIGGIGRTGIPFAGKRGIYDAD